MWITRPFSFLSLPYKNYTSFCFHNKSKPTHSSSFLFKLILVKTTKDIVTETTRELWRCLATRPSAEQTPVTVTVTLAHQQSSFIFVREEAAMQCTHRSLSLLAASWCCVKNKQEHANLNEQLTFLFCFGFCWKLLVIVLHQILTCTHFWLDS